MAKTPTPSAAPMSDDAADPDDQDTDAGAPDQGDDSDDDAGSEDVLLTVCKEADGTYSLIKGDEEDADGEDTAGSADQAGSPEASNKQTFDSKGALLKGILDILNEDESSTGAGGEDQFQAGFSGGSGGTAAPPAQKY